MAACETIEPYVTDLILVGADTEDPERSTSLEALRGEEALQSLQALKEDRVIVLPAQLFTTNSCTILDAAELLAGEARRAMAP